MCTRIRMDKSVQLHSIRYGKSDANENWMNIQALRSKNTNKRQAKQAIIEDDSNNINKLLYQSMFSRFSCERHQVGMPSAVGIPRCKPFVKQCKFLESSEFGSVYVNFMYLFICFALFDSSIQCTLCDTRICVNGLLGVRNSLKIEQQHQQAI